MTSFKSARKFKDLRIQKIFNLPNTAQSTRGDLTAQFHSYVSILLRHVKMSFRPSRAFRPEWEMEIQRED